MGRYFGGRFGDMLSPTSTIPNTKAILSMRDHYYMKKIAGGGLADPATTIAELDNVVSWSAIPNEDHYTSSAAQGTYYNGTRHKVMYGTGTVDFDSYEYPMYGKFDIRGGDTSKDSFFQLYAPLTDVLYSTQCTSAKLTASCVAMLAKPPFSMTPMFADFPSELRVTL